MMQSRMQQSQYYANNPQGNIYGQSQIRNINQSQYDKSQIYSKYPQQQQQQAKFAPIDPTLTEEELDRKHPSTRINHLACLVALLSIAYGITMVSYSCGARYITLTVFGFIMFILCLCSFYRKQIDKQRCLFYGISAFFIFMTGVTSFVFISQINEQIFCNSQWCHKQVETRDYLEKKYSESQLDQKCRDIDAQYNGTMEYEQTGQFLVSEMIVYCKNDSSECSSTDNMYQHIYWHNLGLTRGMLITLGVLQVLYALWLVCWLKFRNPRDDQYTYDSNGNPQSQVQILDANGSMIINNNSIIQSPNPQTTSVIRNQHQIESRVNDKLNEYKLQSGNQSLVSSTRNMNMSRNQGLSNDNGLIYIGNNNNPSNNSQNLKQSYAYNQNSTSQIQQIGNSSYQNDGVQVVRNVTQKPLAVNPLKNIQQQPQQQAQRIMENSSPTRLAQSQYKQNIANPMNQNVINPINSNLTRSMNKTHQLSSLLNNGKNGNLSPLKQFI